MCINLSAALNDVRHEKSTDASPFKEGTMAGLAEAILVKPKKGLRGYMSRIRLCYAAESFFTYTCISGVPFIRIRVHLPAAKYSSFIFFPSFFFHGHQKCKDTTCVSIHLFIFHL